jgi:predicted permease
MPPKFLFPETQRLWVPISTYWEKAPRDQRGLQVFARMKAGVTQQQAETDLKALTTRLAAAYPRENENWTVFTRSLGEWLLPADVKLVILAMMGAVTLVLLIACSNVANLLLARASARQREIAIRAALGAGRLRIMRQLLTEAVFIGLLSAPLGIGIAMIGIRLLDSSMPPDEVPYFIDWALDARSLAYTIAISMGTGIVFGLAPALQAVRGTLQTTLKEGGRGTAGGRAWLRNSLAVVQIGMSLVLLVGASLFVRSFLNLQNASVGFDTAPLMTMRFYLPGAAYEVEDAKARRVADIVQRVESLPGVEAAFASNFVPMGSGGGGGRAIVEGRAVEDGKEPAIGLVGVTPHMRRTLDLPLLKGRDFTDAEGASRSPLAMINERMARALWPDTDPVGRRFRLTGNDETAEWFTVIGIVADFRHGQGDNNEPEEPTAYVPYPYQQTLNTGITIRVAGDPKLIAAPAREQIRKADPALPIFDVSTMEDLRQLSYWQYRLFGSMFSTFGFIALGLAAIGVYGVLSYSVSQRVQEIGVRVALGAERRDVLRLVVGQGLKLAAAGVLFGLIGAFAATPAIKTLLYNVTPTDPVSFAAVSVFLTVVALVASYVPARRAMAVDPIIALRND